MKIHRLAWATLCGMLCIGVLCRAQENPAPQKRTFVTFESASNVVVSPGHSAPVQFKFRVQDPYHINSSKPLVPELIPTQVHLSLPGEVAVGRMQYPAGQLMSFPFDPSTKLSVYSGDFAIHGMVIAPTAAATGTYTIHGELKYQACDNNACYPPKNLPFTFNVKVGSRGKAGPKARPTASSPHIHN
ncbi:MAG: protein-disulfide reductase DsbD domain-containing protein [Candidatus Angelobacter sp.]